VTMKHGKPWWVPPAHVDPERKPIRNTLRDPITVAATSES